LGIHHVGTRVAYILASHFGTLDAIAGASQEELSGVHEIGEVIAESVHDFFNNAAGKKTVAELKKVGVDPKMEKPAAAAANGELPLAGETIVLTGTMKRFQREELERAILRLGGKASGSVSKKTSEVVFGDKAGSKKIKAEELGIKTTPEDDFVARVGEEVLRAALG
jgi:DNA ligase (NAD+)